MQLTGRARIGAITFSLLLTPLMIGCAPKEKTAANTPPPAPNAPTAPKPAPTIPPQVQIGPNGTYRPK